jgi:hypothetical protein
MNPARLLTRLTHRMHEDPALAVFTSHFAQALSGALKVPPEGLHADAIQSLLLDRWLINCTKLAF